MTNSGLYSYSVRGSVSLGYDMKLLKGVAFCDGEERRVLMGIPPTVWGQLPAVSVVTKAAWPVASALALEWTSDKEQMAYSIDIDLRPYLQIQEELMQKCDDEGQPLYNDLLVGFAPHGSVSIWLAGILQSVLLCHVMAQPMEEHTIRPVGNPTSTPKRMTQYIYRYQVMFGQWDETKEQWKLDEKSSLTEDDVVGEPETIEMDFIEETLFDGTHDKLHNGRLMHYHEAGKPMKLAVRWHSCKQEWTAYFWFDEVELEYMFDHFYGCHSDTKTDFMICINPEKNHYELSLYRQGLNVPHVIPKKAYQLLVFKNKFERFRSANYNQEHEAWRW